MSCVGTSLNRVDRFGILVLGIIWDLSFEILILDSATDESAHADPVLRK